MDFHQLSPDLLLDLNGLIELFLLFFSVGFVVVVDVDAASVVVVRNV